MYQRERCLVRLAAWLAVYGEDAARRAGASVLIRSGRPGNLSELLQPPERAVALLDAPPEALRAWRASLQGEPGTIRAYCGHARNFYAWAQAENLRPDNPMIRIPVPKARRGIPRPISEEDLERAFATAPRRVRPMLALASGSGLRACEIAGLRREDVIDTATRPYLRVISSKGGASHVVYLNPFVLAELRLHGLPPRGWLFPRLDGQPGPVPAAVVSKLCNAHLRKSGSDATLHQLRHRCLTRLHEATMNIMLVKETAGHASLSSTQVYVQVSDAAAAAGMDLIPSPSGRLRVVGE
jgi:integrase/recombinase XerC